MKVAIQTAFAIVLCAVLFARCDGLLETEPLGTLTEDTFYQTPEHFDAAALGIYSTLTNPWSRARGGPHILYAAEFPTDDFTNQQGSNDFEEFVWTASNAAASPTVWASWYKGVLRANVVLDQLETTPAFEAEEERAPYAAEARFLRAYFYFNLVTLWCNPPLVLEPIRSLDETRIGNADQDPAAVWDQIEEDLAYAAEHLPMAWEGQTGRATRGAALALLGKAELFRAQWLGEPAKYAEAEEHLQAVVDLGAYELVADFNANFMEESENNAESVFEIQLSRGDFNPWLFADWAYEVGGNVGSATSGRLSAWYPGTFQGASPPGAGSGEFPATQNLVDAFEAGDPRRFYTVYVPGDPIADETFLAEFSPTGYYPAKYVRPLNAEASGVDLTATTNNERVLRYADVLLMLAEAEILMPSPQPAEAAMHLNEVRARARDMYEATFGEAAPADLLPPIEASDVAALHEALRRERRVEFAGEAHRWDDLVRWHRAGLIDIETDVDFGEPLAQRNFDASRHLCRPIPQYDIDVVGADLLIQNPGY